MQITALFDPYYKNNIVLHKTHTITDSIYIIFFWVWGSSLNDESDTLGIVFPVLIPLKSAAGS